MNSNRNPKSLRDFVEKSKLDSDAVEVDKNNFEETFKNLRNLSQEEKTEIGLLRSRIDEQSRLIMILKQRGDEYIRKNNTLEKLNQDLIDKRDQLENEFKLSVEKLKQLKDKFDYLANNHEELIKIKDEYKHKNVELTEKYQVLVEKMKNVPSEELFEKEKSLLNEKIELLNKSCDDYLNKYITVKNENESYLNRLKEELSKSELKDREIETLNKRNNDLSKQNHDLLERLQILKEESNKINEKNLARINELLKEKEEHNLLYENIKKDKKILSDNHVNLEKNYKNVCHELNKYKESYNKDNLHSELEEAYIKYSDLEKQFNAYKEYTNNLIEKEKELNKKLRFMIS